MCLVRTAARVTSSCANLHSEVFHVPNIYGSSARTPLLLVPPPPRPLLLLSLSRNEEIQNKGQDELTRSETKYCRVSCGFTQQTVKIMLVIHVVPLNLRNCLSHGRDVCIRPRYDSSLRPWISAALSPENVISFKGNVGDAALPSISPCPATPRRAAIKPTTGYSFRGRIGKTSARNKRGIAEVLFWPEVKRYLAGRRQRIPQRG